MKISLKLALRGCNLVIIDKDLSSIEKMKHDFKKLGVNVMTLIADVTKHEETCQVRKILYEKFESIDFLVSI